MASPRSSNEEILERLNGIATDLEESLVIVTTISEKQEEDHKNELKKNDPKALQVLSSLFILLFDVTKFGHTQVAEKCGPSLVELLSKYQDAFTSLNDADDDQVEIINQSLLIISALANYDGARCLLVEQTAILKICIDNISSPQMQGNEPRKVAMRDKLLSCLSCLVRGFVIESVEAGIIEPMISLLQNIDCISDQRGSAAIILSLIEPEKGKVIGARIVLSGVVPLLCETFARKIPLDCNENDKVAYKNLGIIGLRCMACILRHQQLARESAMQFFVTASGEEHLKSIIEHASDTSDVSRWLFAAEILVWIAAEKSCYGILGRLGAKQALSKVASHADPYGKWKTLVNQAVSVNVFPALWSSNSIFKREQHAFLALWMNRYTHGGLVSMDANAVRSKLCSDEWISFAMTLVASPDPITRRHAHATLQSLRGNILSTSSCWTSSSRPSSVSSYSQRASASSKHNNALDQKRTGTTSRIRSTKKTVDQVGALLYCYLLESIGLEKDEECEVVETLKRAKLPLHVLLRPGIMLADIEKVLCNLCPGTKYAVMDALRDLRTQFHEAREVVKEKSLGIKKKAIEIPDMKDVVSRSTDEASDERHLCFISYSWAQKTKAKLLKKNLEKFGIKCWMDDQQLEGGSMLFEEIDDGISECEVVISCLSPEYAKSINCNREFLLASDRKKTTIPVVVEELESWPPRGSLGPLLAGKLYIKMDDSAFNNGDKSTEIRQLAQSVMQLISSSAGRYDNLLQVSS